QRVVEGTDDLGRSARVESAVPLQAAEHALHEGLVREKLCAFGETPFRLRRLELTLEGAVALPPSELKRMRRALSDALSVRRPEAARHVHTGLRPDEVVAPIARGPFDPSRIARPSPAAGTSFRPQLLPLLRTLEQVEVALRLGFDELQLDFMELVGLGAAVERVRASGARAIVATPRVQKPGE